MEKWDLVEMAQAMCIDDKRLPEGIETELAALQEILEAAVDGAPQRHPLPPAYGKTACQSTDADIIKAETERENRVLPLREDKITPFHTSLITVSPRNEEKYVIVPRVIRG